MTKKSLRTNAKVNLFLRVLGRRPDGYHELETIFHSIGLADVITVTPTSTGKIEVDMRLEHDGATDLIAPESNLVYRAAAALHAKSDALNEGVAIEIVKRIPIGSGLGGGSGNAAGVLSVLNDVWAAGLKSDELADLALEVGADVPYCLTGGTALATGRGERLTTLPAPASLSLVLGLSDDPLLTRAVYEELDSNAEADVDVGAAPVSLALGAGAVEDLASLLHNDLERAALRLRPELGDAKRAMLDAGALGAAMSGSGPTIFAVARDTDHATEIAGRVEAIFDRVVIASSRPECIERLE